MTDAPTKVPPAPPGELGLLMAGEHPDPHRILGLHDGIVRVRHPVAIFMVLLAGDQRIEMGREGEGLFSALLPGGIKQNKGVEDTFVPYRLEATLPDGTKSVLDDPYRLWPTLGELDLHLFGEGRHRRLWQAFGSHFRSHQGLAGTSFAVWAPSARSVRVVGDWNGWDGRAHPMRALGGSGVWEVFIPDVKPGAHYKYEILTPSGAVVQKADPMAREAEVPPATASIVAQSADFAWADADWITKRDASGWPGKKQMSVYEVHLGSWRRVPEEGNRPLTYVELADELPAYVKGLGFTHVELMPITAYPFEGSWGYQVSSYYAPSPRQGSPDDLRRLIDAFHAAGVGVILDWVPAHFPKDEWALARFDGTALYEHADPRQGEHPDWGTLVFNMGRHEVRNFLVGSALYWLEEFHVDGLRVDAVASMLYLDYSRKENEWIPNEFGGRENLEAVSFLREMNEVVHQAHPGVVTLAEESTAWPAVSRPTWLGGLGFSFKWNMGWMHDTLRYFSKEPIHRRWHHNDLTFGLLYAFSENFVLPLSHDEVVHGKGSLIDKMPGDHWQKLANLRALYGWMWAHPGKKLLFMGGEIAQSSEWSHASSLDWHLLDEAPHGGVQKLLGDLNSVSAAEPALWEMDCSSEGFRWVDAADVDSNVLSFLRLSEADGTGAPPVLCVANLSPVPRYGYKLGVPQGGQWRELLNTDSAIYGGSGVGNLGSVTATEPGSHGFPFAAEFTLPPLAVVWFTPQG